MHSRPVLVLLGIFLIVSAWSLLGFLRKMETTSENQKIANNKVVELRQQKEEFSTEIERLKTESGVEENIRERFPVAKEGEGVIVIIEDKEELKAVEKPSEGFFSFFTNWFK